MVKYLISQLPRPARGRVASDLRQPLDTAMPMTALALAAALSGLPDITWERDRAEDLHELTLCQIHRDQLNKSRDMGKDERHARATAICGMLAREYLEKWDFDEQDAFAASAIDFDEAIRRGYAVKVQPTAEELKQFDLR